MLQSSLFRSVGALDGERDTSAVDRLLWRVLRAWKEKSSSPTSVRTSLLNLLDGHSVRKAFNVLHESIHVTDNAAGRNLKDCKRSEAGLGDMSNAQDVLVQLL